MEHSNEQAQGRDSADRTDGAETRNNYRDSHGASSDSHGAREMPVELERHLEIAIDLATD